MVLATAAALTDELHRQRSTDTTFLCNKPVTAGSRMDHRDGRYDVSVNVVSFAARTCIGRRLSERRDARGT